MKMAPGPRVGELAAALYQLVMSLCDTREAVRGTPALAPLGERAARSTG